MEAFLTSNSNRFTPLYSMDQTSRHTISFMICFKHETSVLYHSHNISYISLFIQNSRYFNRWSNEQKNKRIGNYYQTKKIFCSYKRKDWFLALHSQAFSHYTDIDVHEYRIHMIRSHREIYVVMQTILYFIIEKIAESFFRVKSTEMLKDFKLISYRSAHPLCRC